MIVAILMTPILMAGAVTLPDAFDEPCMGGMGIIADICIAVNLLNDEQVAQEARITINEGNIVTLENRATILEGNVTSLDSKVKINEDNITTLIATQLLEQIEQDVQGVQLISLEAQLAAIPETLIKTKIDTNGLPCLSSGLIAQPDWCPGGSARNFDIPDVDVIATSFVSVAIVGLGGDQIGCTVTDISVGEFHVRCFNTFDGNILRYIVMN